MQKNPFIILGLDRENCNQQDVKEAYERLRAKYSQDRFLEGEAGHDAAVKLGEVETAYRDAMRELTERSTIESGSAAYAEIEALMKQGKLNDAQTMLDYITTRDAEWHYLQSAIYWKKDWKTDSKKQLEMALSLDPTNAKYKTAMEKLNAAMGMGTQQNAGPRNTYDGNGNPYNAGQQGGYNQGYNRSYNQNPYYRERNSSADCCQQLICADCCCECMGGDLIRCC